MGWMIILRFPGGRGDFLLSKTPWPNIGFTQPANQWVRGKTFLGGKADRAST